MTFFAKRLSKAQLGELQAMDRMIREDQFRLAVVKKNTAFVSQGQEYVKTLKGMIQLLENEKNNFISKCAHDLGFTGPISLDMSNGKVWERPTTVAEEMDRVKDPLPKS